MDRIRWERLPHVRELPAAREWLLQGAISGLSPVTLEAYSRAVERYLAYCQERRIHPGAATTAHIAAYLDELTAAGLRGATLLQRLTALRLFYTFVVEQGGRADNPVSTLATLEQARHLDRRSPSEQAPWIPNEAEWVTVLEVARREWPRTRLMLALAYEGALRREELCRLRLADVDPGRTRLRVPDQREMAYREVALSPAVATQCASYVGDRVHRAVARPSEMALFLSESPRNRAEPLSIWTWSKVVARLAQAAGVSRFTTHTPRHLRLTDLARAGWTGAAISRFAGHSRSGLAQPYLALASRYPEPRGNTLEFRAEQFAEVLFRAS